MINLSYYTLMHEVRSYSSLADVTVQLHRQQHGEEKFVPHATVRGSVRTLHLIQPEPAWSADQLLMWRGDFYHEMGHFDPAVMDDYEAQTNHRIDCKSFFFKGWNCLMDYRQEKNRLGEFAGRDEILSRTHRMALDGIMNHVGDDWNKLDGKDDNSVNAVMLWLSTQARSEWQRDLAGVAEALKDKFVDKQLDIVNELQSSNIIEQLDEANTAEKTLKVWKQVLAKFDRDPEEEEQQAQSDGEGGGDGEASDSDKGEDGEGEGSDGKGNGDGKGERVNKDSKVKWEDLSIRNHDEDYKASYARQDIDYSGYTGDGFEVSDHIDVDNYVTGTGSPYSTPDSEYVHRTNGTNVHTGLANKIRKLLQVKTQTLTVQGQKKGKLSGKSMYRVACPALGTLRERVFKKKIQQFDLDTAVSVVVDFSGSMGGSRMEHAIISAIMLNDAISKIGVPLEILGFTDTSVTRMSVLKTFNKKISNEQLRMNMCKAANCMHNNSDGEAILWAYHRLATQPNKRKLMIVLSDGQPASRRGGCRDFTKRVVTQIQNDKRAEIYGVGIESNAVKDYYKHNTVINSSDDLESAVINVIKSHILK